jgi:hypothetical protein
LQKKQLESVARKGRTIEGPLRAAQEKRLSRCKLQHPFQNVLIHDQLLRRLVNHRLPRVRFIRPNLAEIRENAAPGTTRAKLRDVEVNSESVIDPIRRNLTNDKYVIHASKKPDAQGDSLLLHLPDCALGSVMWIAPPDAP